MSELSDGLKNYVHVNDRTIMDERLLDGEVENVETAPCGSCGERVVKSGGVDYDEHVTTAGLSL